MTRPIHDVAIVGGGIVGLATAHRLRARHPSLDLVLLEKENRVAAHQSGHNSGVIHSGIYYRPGSSKARNCVRGAELMKEFCRARDIPHEVCGKVVVATEERELPALDELARRAAANGVPGTITIGPEELKDIEPHARGPRALFVPSAGIVDYRVVCETLKRELEETGSDVRLGAKVVGIRGERGEMVLAVNDGVVHSRYLITCGGLQSDRLAGLAGVDPGVSIAPFRGEYYELVPERRELVRGLIYPVPDPRFPFLGVHFTRVIDGSVEAGPNAVVAFAREGYRRRDIRLQDLGELVGSSGFWRLAFRHWRTGIGEMYRSFNKSAFVRGLARLVPEIRAEDLRPGGAGVRAQALTDKGELVDDFAIADSPRSLHVVNAPSPAATASLAIAEEIVDRASQAFDLG